VPNAGPSRSRFLTGVCMISAALALPVSPISACCRTVIEAMLNHVSGHKSGVAGVYNRSAYEREVKTAVALWDNHLRSIANNTDRKVIPLRAPVT
jgi:hypothetical protein